MGLTVEDCSILFGKLRQQGWQQEGEFLYAPNRTIWFRCADPWQGDLSDFRERMIGRVRRINYNRGHYPDPADCEKVLSDTEAVIAALSGMLDGGVSDDHPAGQQTASV
jgi:hypothetical protein